jgi:hypothetical protein
MNLLAVVEHSPLRPDAIESEVNELARQLTLVLFEFFYIGSQPQRATCSAVRLIAFSAHRLNRRQLEFARNKVAALECPEFGSTYSAFCLWLLQPRTSGEPRSEDPRTACYTRAPFSKTQR